MPEVFDTDGMDSLLAGSHPLWWVFLSPTAAPLLPAPHESLQGPLTRVTPHLPSGTLATG